MRPPQKVRHNVRVLRAFRRSRQHRRDFTVMAGDTSSANLGGVTVRFRPDLLSTEAKISCILYNFKDQALSRDTAHITLDLAAWVLTENRLLAPPVTVEYVDFANQRVHRGTGCTLLLSQGRGGQHRQLYAYGRRSKSVRASHEGGECSRRRGG